MLMWAIHADREVDGNKAKSYLHAVPRYQQIVRYLPRAKSALGPPTTLLATFLDEKLLWLRNNLSDIEIRGNDGRHLDRIVGDPSRGEWYKRRNGEIFIAHFMTGKNRFGTPYRFDLSKQPDIKAAVDETLAPLHPEATPQVIGGCWVQEGRAAVARRPKGQKGLRRRQICLPIAEQGAPPRHLCDPAGCAVRASHLGALRDVAPQTVGQGDADQKSDVRHSRHPARHQGQDRCAGDPGGSAATPAALQHVQEDSTSLE
jgi:hypothetical protein